MTPFVREEPTSPPGAAVELGEVEQPQPPARSRVWRVLGQVLVAALTLAVIDQCGPALGARWPRPILFTMLVGVALVTALPSRAFLLTGITGVAVLGQWTALRTTVYHLLLIAGVYALRHRPRWLLGFLVVTVILIPKELFRLVYQPPFAHDWINPFLLAHLFLVVLLWWSAAARGRVGETGPWAWLSLFLFPSHPMNPMNFGPTDVWRARTARARDALETGLLIAVKAGAVAALAWLWPAGQLAQRPAEELLAGSWWGAWRAVAHSYLVCALTLSGTADLAILVARLFGWRLAHPFRWALLAWNPVELWRRWAIYNRKLLLQLVYFPLGGSERRRTLNVMLTFAASGLVLHSGWLGSKYWETGLAGWRDQTVYFLLQGLAVCACLTYWSWRGKDPRDDRELRWSVGRALGVLGTQALSALVHVLVLAPNLGFGDRFRLIARCLGLGALVD